VPKQPFCAEQFTATKWATAKEKATWINGMVSFILKGFPEERWREGLYHHLYNMYCHIAHYNRHGFYAEWFATDHERLAWLEYVAKGGAFGGGMGEPTYTWCYVEAALSAWIRDSPFIELYRFLCAQHIETRERAQLAYLQDKYAKNQSSAHGANGESDEQPGEEKPLPLASSTPTRPLTNKRRKTGTHEAPSYVQVSLFIGQPV